MLLCGERKASNILRLGKTPGDKLHANWCWRIMQCSAAPISPSSPASSFLIRLQWEMLSLKKMNEVRSCLTDCFSFPSPSSLLLTGLHAVGPSLFSGKCKEEASVAGSSSSCVGGGRDSCGSQGGNIYLLVYIKKFISNVLAPFRIRRRNNMQQII